MMKASLLLLLAAAPPQDGGATFAGFSAQDALSYRIFLVADPREDVALVGCCEYRFRAVAPLEGIDLHSSAGADWRLAFHDADGRPLATERSGAGIRVLLGRPLGAGEETVFHATFSGDPPDGLYRRPNRYGDPVVFTDHFSSRARGWLPCEDHPSDRAAFTVELLYPAGFESIGSGAWASRESFDAPACCGVARPDGEGEWQVAGGATRSDLPTYMLSFAVGRYARVAEDGDPRLVPHFVWRQDLARARRGLRHHADWMAAMEGMFGPYVYAKYCVVQVPTRWGGMENAGNTWIMESLFDGRDAGVSTLAHEFAHQWFGDAVGYGDWAEAWLSEGFASYFGPWLDARTGGPPLERVMAQTRRAWLASPVGRERPIRWSGFDEPDELFGSSAINTYQKGAWVLHMLRLEVGDEAFFAGIADFYRGHVGQALGTAELQAALERASGRELGWFFAQWLDRPGCPELEIEWREDSVVVRQRQEQGPCRFLLPLQWVDAAGATQDVAARIEADETLIPIEPGYRAPVVDPRVELLFRKL